MPQQVVIRSYSIPDGELKQKADGLAKTLTRDLPDLAARKITAATVSNLGKLISNFDEHSTDEELLGLVNDATNIKNATRKQAEIAVRSVRNMADIVYSGKGRYNNFGFEDLTHLTDADFYRLTKRVVRMVTRFLTDLQPQGLTEEQITALKTLSQKFDNDLDNIEDAIKDRDLETQERVTKGNTLWAEMTKLASIGKAVYEDTNEAKFNDYVLMPAPGTSAGADKPTA